MHNINLVWLFVWKSPTDHNFKPTNTVASSNDRSIGTTAAGAAARSFNPDPAEWTLSAELVDNFIQNPPCQDRNADFSYTARVYPDKTRYFRREHFQRKLTNGKMVNRDWMLFSPSNGKLYCYVCKLLCPDGDDHESHHSNFRIGFNDWKNASARLASHERGTAHILAIKKSLEMKVTDRIHTSFEQRYLHEEAYWTNVLKRIVAVISFLAERGLPFRGTTEQLGCANNGNYLGCLELVSKFDPFLAQHLEVYGNKGKGSVSYLSSTICDEFILLLAEKVKSTIVREIKDAKYYGVSIDSTPDVSHIDQLTVIFRYVMQDGSAVERFLQYVVIEHHDGEYLFGKLQEVLEANGIDLMDCRGQSYDNASNMSGVYSGVQARVCKINPLAQWVPCAAHSLNLVGVAAAESCLEAVKYFGLIQAVYNFVSISPKMGHTSWEKVKPHLLRMLGCVADSPRHSQDLRLLR